MRKDVKKGKIQSWQTSLFTTNDDFIYSCLITVWEYNVILIKMSYPAWIYKHITAALWVSDLNTASINWELRFLFFVFFPNLKFKTSVDWFLLCLGSQPGSPSPPPREQVPCCWLLLNIKHCAICYSVNETLVSAMFKMHSSGDVSQHFAVCLDRLPIGLEVTEKTAILLLLPRASHVVGFVYCITAVQTEL